MSSIPLSKTKILLKILKKTSTNSLEKHCGHDIKQLCFYSWLQLLIYWPQEIWDMKFIIDLPSYRLFNPVIWFIQSWNESFTFRDGNNLHVFLLYFPVYYFHTEKAQGFESELINSHRDEVNQLQKMIAQKEEELNKTVQRYEQVLQVQQNKVKL